MDLRTGIFWAEKSGLIEKQPCESLENEAALSNMRSTTSNRTTASTWRSIPPIEDDPASDAFMKKQGFRSMTAKERAQARKFFACADRSNIAASHRP
jgi:hypothetical protein